MIRNNLNFFNFFKKMYLMILSFFVRQYFIFLYKIYYNKFLYYTITYLKYLKNLRNNINHCKEKDMIFKII